MTFFLFFFIHQETENLLTLAKFSLSGAISFLARSLRPRDDDTDRKPLPEITETPFNFLAGRHYTRARDVCDTSLSFGRRNLIGTSQKMLFYCPVTI